MIIVSVKADVDAVVRRLGAYRQNIPVVTAIALTRTAQAAQSAVKDGIRRVFDRPTPYAINSTRIVSANARNVNTGRTRHLEAEVKFIRQGSNASEELTQLSLAGRQVNFIQPQVGGGTRPAKRFEELLRKARVLPQGKYIAPGLGLRLDRYGNASPGLYQEVLSAFGAQFDPLRNRSRSLRSLRKASRRRFALIKGVGILLREGATIQDRINKARTSKAREREKAKGGQTKGTIVFAFVRAPRYRPRLPFYSIVEKVRAERFVPELEAELRRKRR